MSDSPFRNIDILDFARDLTKLAIENQLITQCSNPKATAMEVATFYQTLLENMCEK